MRSWSDAKSDGVMFPVEVGEEEEARAFEGWRSVFTMAFLEEVEGFSM